MQFPSRKPSPNRCWRTANQNPPLKWNTSPFMLRHVPTSPPHRGAPAALGRMILVLLHLSMVATAQAAHRTLAIPQPISRPYLATFGAPALRFQEVIPTPPASVKPIAGGPPVAAITPEVAAVSLANDQAAASTPPMPIERPVADQITTNPVSSTPEQLPSTENRPATKALPILPDDTRSKVQSQDFLPLFRFPGTSGSAEDVNVIIPGAPVPPVPNSLPPSSATYRQL